MATVKPAKADQELRKWVEVVEALARQVESWAKGYLNGNVADLVVFGILIGVMLIRPSGLLGTPALQKV